ncbi:MAG: hypothetical protein HOM68_14315 [Gemmatimonadetes bacterium]|jgi:ankyrin repeat protein|nr:hypothetical protein [Gemmatimonadota bacterium]MBT4610763.1 hypothetical protein [Gemmatimonadota bacterium]MBT5057714.1 hypothetical protein [Gemmatimonadota bacterium]MBT5141374.1 hypothetical protein [Gemmatimonadota bacterium]MBT5590455.1 hypothetical protein [Gemmatimonadota bacterium]
MSKRLPYAPSLENLRNQARSLLTAVQDGDRGAIDRFTAHHPKLSGQSPEAITQGRIVLRDAQLVLAREYGFASWQKMSEHVRRGEGDAADELRAAIDSDDLDRVSAVVATHAELLEAPMGYAGAGPLSWAAECRGEATPPTAARLAIVQALIDAGADANEHTGTPLFRASLNDDRIPMMELLVRNGADVNSVWKDYGPLLLGPCETLAPQSLAWLIDHGADPNRTVAGKYFNTALDMVIGTYARSPSLHACVEALVVGGVEFEDGAAMDIHRGRLDLLEERLKESPDLLNARLDFRRGKEYGGLYGGAPLHRFTLLHLCAEFGELEAARLLIRLGADVNAQSEAGPNEGQNCGSGDQTPIYHAVTANSNCSFAVVQLLIEHGADLSVRATVHVPGADIRLHDVTPLGYALNYPNDYQPGPGSDPKAALNAEPHGNVVEVLRQRDAPE